MHLFGQNELRRRVLEDAEILELARGREMLRVEHEVEQNDVLLVARMHVHLQRFEFKRAPRRVFKIRGRHFWVLEVLAL